MTALRLDIPTVETERLTLRGPETRDFGPVADFFADEARSWGFGGPKSRNDAWRWFAGNIGHWALNGYGFWTVETQDGDIIGIVGLWAPEGWSEPELGWVMFAGSEGKGLAREAAEAARDYAYDHMGFTTLTSNILPGNARSVALAERLGAWHEADFENVTHGIEMRFRHPGPDARAKTREGTA
ncbi:GNAT family N-acetyltransferase [Pseudodonghicola xiamenensis]|uniref:GNAT family acetyltransferase n=1 Tax=Pseudodonghicola xiamenensis TaxID=337702 RepID=A0A8J3H6V6_9RHOB|nr:GNAT family N-acetyltransferase [Pseudodonghicola xiamenensis]GHG85968.1 GNAT family acetyltransferase [Pseudodonghicola xiamenensis]